MKLLAFGILGFCLILVSLAVLAPARADDYLPLELGNYWIYDGAVVGEHEESFISGTMRLWDGEVSVMTLRNSTQNEGNDIFWTVGDDGDVLLWGFQFPEGGGALYVPPLVEVDPPLFLGKEWSVTSGFYSYTLSDTLYWGEWTLVYTVLTDETLDLPVGSLHAYGITARLESDKTLPAALRRLDRMGLLAVSPHRQVIPYWWSEGVGQVQYNTSDRYQLVTYGNEPVLTQTTSWGRIKALYAH